MSDLALPPSYLEGTHRIAMELSDWCNLAKLHEACPAHHRPGKTFLSTKVIEDVVGYAGRVGYKGAFCWHIYNEPLADKRIVSLCEMVRDRCPTSMGSLIWTNAELLDADLARTLVKAKVYLFRVSLYTKKIAERMREVALEVPEANWAFSSYIQGFDDRREQYTRRNDRRNPCYAPLVDLTINHNGHLQLCCMDWACSTTFGDLNSQSFEQAMGEAYPMMKQVQSDLIGGERLFRICQGCDLERPQKPEELQGLSKLPLDNIELDNRNPIYDPRAL